MLVLTVFEIAAVLLLRTRVTRWLQRGRVWTVVVAGNGVIMTIFLWHLTAALFAIGVLYHVGFPQAAGGSVLWWLTRPLWLAAAAVPLAALIAVFGRSERPHAARYEAAGADAELAVGLGVALLAFGVFRVACSNLADITANARISVAVVTVTPLEVLAVGLLGFALVRHAVRVISD